MPDKPDSMDAPTSDELIRRAKKDFAPTVYSRTYRVVSRAEDIEKMVEETMNTDAMGEAMAQAMDAGTMTDMMDTLPPMDTTDRENRMASDRRSQAPTPRRVEHLTTTTTTSGPVPEASYPSGSAGNSGTGGGNAALRAVGVFLLLAMGGLWILLLIGAVQDPDNAGSVIGGGVVLTAIPLLLAFLLLRKSRKPQGPSGFIS